MRGLDLDSTLAGTAGGASASASGRVSALGRYEITGVLGRGSMGVVYSGWDPLLQREVAVKALLPDRVRARRAAQIRAEALALGRLSHPNVVPVYDVGSDRGTTFIVMERIRGGTLRQWSDAGRDEREIVAVFVGAGRGLHAAHRLGIIHCDFKPDNVLVDARGQPRVADFGLARGMGASDRTSTWPDLCLEDVTRSGALSGTPAYMAPEQFERGSLDARTDQFAFCVALFEALEGRRPFTGTTLGELAHQVLHASRHDLGRGAACPGRLLQVIRRGLSIRPDDRFPTMRALLDALYRAQPARHWAWIVPAIFAAGAGIAGTTFEARPPAPVVATAVAPASDEPLASPPALEQARTAERAGDLPRMLAAAERWIADDAADPRARLLRARALHALERDDAALEAAIIAYEAAVRTGDPDSVVEAGAFAADLAPPGADEARFLGAARVYAEGPSVSAEARAWLALTESRRDLVSGRYDDAIRWCRRGLALVPGTNDYALRYGLRGVCGTAALEGQGDPQGLEELALARDELELAVGAEHPYALWARLKFADAAATRNDYEAALADVERVRITAARLGPRGAVHQARATIIEARVQYEAGRYPAALSALERAAELPSSSLVDELMILDLKSIVLTQLERHDEAYRAIRRLADLYTTGESPDSARIRSIRLRLADAEFGRGELDAAETLYTEIWKASEADLRNRVFAQRGLARIAEQRGDYAQAAELTATILGATEQLSGPGYAAMIRVTYARSLAGLGDRRRAESEFRTALEQVLLAGPAWWKQQQEVRDQATAAGFAIEPEPLFRDFLRRWFLDRR